MQQQRKTSVLLGFIFGAKPDLVARAGGRRGGWQFEPNTMAFKPIHRSTQPSTGPTK